VTDRYWRKLIRDAEDDAATQSARLQYADWLEENGRRVQAAMQRQKAGVSKVRWQPVLNGVAGSPYVHRGYAAREVRTWINNMGPYKQPRTGLVRCIEIRTEVIAEMASADVMSLQPPA
jgi:uncharacterized protein (TIGR02996 family)